MAGLFHGPFPAQALLRGLPLLFQLPPGVFSCPDLQLAQQRRQEVLRCALRGVLEFSRPAVTPVSAADGELQDARREELGAPDRLPSRQCPVRRVGQRRASLPAELADPDGIGESVDGDADLAVFQRPAEF
jgi:hypothetical protein